MKSPALFDATAAPLRGTMLVEANAGTGKTTALCQLYARFIVEDQRDVASILLVTFTRAAVAEVRQRIRERLQTLVHVYARAGTAPPEAPAHDTLTGALCRRWQAIDPQEVAKRLIGALAEFDQASIFTIHGFCQRVLAECPIETRAMPGVLDTSFSSTALHDLAQDFLIAHRVQASPAVVRATRSIQALDLAQQAQAILAQPHVMGLSGAGELNHALSHTDLLGILDRWESARRAAWALWDLQVVTLLQAQRTCLVAKVYQERFLAAWLRRLPALLAHGCAEDFCDKGALILAVERLRQSVLLAHALPDRQAPHHPLFAALDPLAELTLPASQACAAATRQLKLAFIASARQALVAKARQAGVRSFDDLLQDVHAALTGPQGPSLAQTLRERYPIALIDEFQDTDAVQYEVFARVWHDPRADGALYLVGDPKQAIYGFRGADVFAYLHARQQIGDNRAALLDNFRSRQGLVHGINTLFGRAHFPFALAQIEFQPAQVGRHVGALIGQGQPQVPLRLAGLCSADEQNGGDALTLRWVSDEIVRMLTQGYELDDLQRPLVPRDIAVLCESNWQAQTCYEYLLAAGVPAILGSNLSVFASNEAQQVLVLMQAMLAPESSRHLRLALLTPIIGLDAGTVALARESDGGGDDVQAQWSVHLAYARECWQSHGIAAGLHQILRRAGCKERWIGERGGERAYANLLHVIELAQAEETARHVGPETLMAWLRQQTDDRQAMTMVQDEALMRLESEEDAVFLVTVHKSKGLQYRVVFCTPIGERGAKPLTLGQWPAQHVEGSPGKYTLSVETGESVPIMAKVEGLAESLRLLYVALTRAQSHCTLVLPSAYFNRGANWGQKGGAKLGALSYLLHQPPRNPLDAGESVTSASWYEQVSSRLDTCDWVADFAALESSSNGAIALSWELVGAEPLRMPLRAGPHDSPVVAQPWRMPAWSLGRSHSFSSLIEQGERATDREIEVADEIFGRDEPLADDGSLIDESICAEDLVTLAHFPRGRRIGRLIHRLFEIGDWQQTDPLAWVPVIVGEPEARGLTPAEVLILAQAINEMLDARFSVDEQVLSLRKIDRRDRVAELRFSLAIGESALPTTAAAVAQVLAQPHHPPPVIDFAQRWGVDDPRLLQGQLNGAIDLVFRWEGRYYLVDFKSNDLGPARGAYSNARMWQSMVDDGYVLQYHLYAVALHRHLRSRMRDYDYERHFGGVLYLYMRGMHPQATVGWAVLTIRPPLLTIEGLDRLFGGGSAQLPSQVKYYA